MKKSLYSIRDSKSWYGAPFLDESDASAIRGFRFSVAKAQSDSSLIGFAPEDFSLFRIGEFDTESGSLLSLKAPKFLCNGVSEVYSDEKS